MSHAIRAEGLLKRYGDTLALNGAALEVPAGKAVGGISPGDGQGRPGGPHPGVRALRR